MTLAIKFIIAVLLGLLFAPDSRADGNPTCEPYDKQRAMESPQKSGNNDGN